MTVLCDVMEVKPSGFYSYCKRKDRAPDAGEMKKLLEIRDIHRDVDKSFGSRRMAQAMTDRGYPMGRFQARTLMAQARCFPGFR